jgi:hypothetical protein
LGFFRPKITQKKSSGVIRADRYALKMKYQKPIFSIENAYIFQLVNGQIYNAKNIFFIAFLFRKIGRKKSTHKILQNAMLGC